MVLIIVFFKEIYSGTCFFFFKVIYSGTSSNEIIHLHFIYNIYYHLKYPQNKFPFFPIPNFQTIPGEREIQIPNS